MRLSASRRRRTALSWLIALCGAGLSGLAYAQEPKPADKDGQKVTPLKDVVRLVEAEPSNEAWSTTVQPGAAATFRLSVLKAISGENGGELTVTGFNALQTAVPSVSARMRLHGATTWEQDLHLALDGGVRALDVQLLLEQPRVGTTYKGRLALSAAGQLHSWEATITTPPSPQAKFAVHPIPPLRIVKFSPCRWLTLVIPCDPLQHAMSFTLGNQSDARLTHVRVRFEPPGGEANKSTTSNFSIDSFSFREEMHEADAGRVGATVANQKPAAQTPLDLENRSIATDIQLAPNTQRTLTAVVEPLAAGSYSGTLRFGAAEVDESQEPRLPVVVQVRHHWTLPAFVILLGSALGWFGSNYVVGVRKTRALKRRLFDLRARADDFARTDTLGRTWHCPSEARSYGLARVHLVLSQLTQLSTSVFPMLLQEDEIKLRCADAERRLAALESIRKARQEVEHLAVHRPAVQMKLHRLLDSLHETLEDPAFGDGQQAAVAKRLEPLNAWTSPEKFLECYRQAILERLATDVPHSLDQINSFVSPSRKASAVSAAPPSAAATVAVGAAPGHLGSPIFDLPEERNEEETASSPNLYDQLRCWWQKLPTRDVVKTADIDSLERHDVTIGTLNLLWRERRKPWAATLVETAARRDAPLEALFEVVDEEAWKYLEENKSQIVFNAREGEDNPSAYEPVSVGLSVTAPDVDDNRIEYHPLHVAWRVSLQQPKSRWRRSRQPTTQARTVSTPGLRMTRYFPTAGTVTITASLVWKKKAAPIAIPSQVQFQVVGDRKYQRSSTLTGWSDYLVIMIGALFATATGIGTVYDATFGGFGQYLSLLAWAAGASTGANLFKEIGTTATFGGRTDVTLPTR